MPLHCFGCRFKLINRNPSCPPQTPFKLAGPKSFPHILQRGVDALLLLQVFKQRRIFLLHYFKRIVGRNKGFSLWIGKVTDNGAKTVFYILPSQAFPGRICIFQPVGVPLFTHFAFASVRIKHPVTKRLIFPAPASIFSIFRMLFLHSLIVFKKLTIVTNDMSKLTIKNVHKTSLAVDKREASIGQQTCQA